MGATGYNCAACHLAVEVGCGVSWDLTGGYSQVACRRCGTMHLVRHPRDRRDVLSAQPGPLTRDLSADHSPSILGEWVAAKPLPTNPDVRAEYVLPRRIAAVAWGSLACHYCGAVGELGPPDEPWPRDGVPCPRCAVGRLAAVYVTT